MSIKKIAVINRVVRNAEALAYREREVLADKHLLIEAREADLLPWTDADNSAAAQDLLPKLWAGVRRRKSAQKGGWHAGYARERAVFAHGGGTPS